ncbi:MAG: hypothetical protein WDW38_010951 [Sanguina aurantia]
MSPAQVRAAGTFPHRKTLSRARAWLSTLLCQHTSATAATPVKAQHTGRQVGDVEAFSLSPSLDTSTDGTEASHPQTNRKHKQAGSPAQNSTDLDSPGGFASPQLSIGQRPSLGGAVSQVSLLSTTNSEPNSVRASVDMLGRAKSHPMVLQQQEQHTSPANRRPAFTQSASMNTNRIQPASNLQPARSKSYHPSDLPQHTAKNKALIRKVDSAQQAREQPAKRSSNLNPNQEQQKANHTSTPSSAAADDSPHSAHPGRPRKSPSSASMSALSPRSQHPSESCVAPSNPSASASLPHNPCTDLVVSPSTPLTPATLRDQRKVRQLRQLKLIANIDALRVRSGSSSGVPEPRSLTGAASQQQQHQHQTAAAVQPSLPSLSARGCSYSGTVKDGGSHGNAQTTTPVRASCSELLIISTTSQFDLASPTSHQLPSSDGSQQYSQTTPSGPLPHRSLGSCLLSRDGSATGDSPVTSQRSFILASDPLGISRVASGARVGSECGSEPAWAGDLPGSTLSHLTHDGASCGPSFLVHPGLDVSIGQRQHPTSQSQEGCSPFAARMLSANAVWPTCGSESSIHREGPTQAEPEGALQRLQGQQQQQRRDALAGGAAQGDSASEAPRQGVSTGPAFRREGINSMSGTLMSQFAAQLQQGPLGRLSVAGLTLSHHSATLSQPPLSRLQHTVVSQSASAKSRIGEWGGREADPPLPAVHAKETAWAPHV